MRLARWNSNPRSSKLRLKPISFVPESTAIRLDSQNLEFSFIGLSQGFSRAQIDWNFHKLGKLWNYNLNYFDFLFSSELSPEQGLELISDYADRLSTLQGGLEPYPISLRAINWIKYLSVHDINDGRFDQSLYFQYNILIKSLEYHLLANHLLENAFSLLFGACYFRDDRFYKKAYKLLHSQLEEQVHLDGGHYERSFMYHQIILFRLLDCINLLRHNSWKTDDLLPLLETKSRAMLSWLHALSFSNGKTPAFKDASPGIAPTNEFLFDYARKLGVELDSDTKPSDSLYRKIGTSGLEMIVDIGKISPSYQPGHAHADELNFALHANDQPIIVDTGISTYEKNQRRQLERSTFSHNCICIDDKNSSEVWSGFRVGRRAKVSILEDSDTCIIASHNGYKSLGATITRKFSLTREGIAIEDLVQWTKTPRKNVCLNLHLHPDVDYETVGQTLHLKDVAIDFEGLDELSEERYMFANKFNSVRESVCLKLKFKKTLRINIRLC